MASEADVALMIDDDVDFREAAAQLLRDHGFDVVEVGTGAEARHALRTLQPDVILLDLGLPDVAGLDFLVELTSTLPVPVIVVSARGGETERAIGLDLGADDYVVKPFAPREMVARVRAAVRRTRRTQPVALTHDGLTLSAVTREVSADGRAVRLTAKEFDVLLLLMGSPRRVFTRRQILEHVWGSSPEWQDDSTVAEHIYRIRRKLDASHPARWIETIRSVGYRFTSDR
jgi:two-component system, OmpR family, phosphate regulon response regulator PhoB